jgi:hypothetical protein
MHTHIQPALTPPEWHRRRSGCVHVDAVDAETHIVVSDPDDQLVSVSGANELFALMALTNDALPDADPRKLTHADVSVAMVLCDQIDRQHPGGMKLFALAEALCDKLVALLPPR